MRLPIDTTSVRFAAAGPAEPVLDYETRASTLDEEDGGEIHLAGGVRYGDLDGLGDLVEGAFAQFAGACERRRREVEQQRQPRESAGDDAL